MCITYLIILQCITSFAIVSSFVCYPTRKISLISKNQISRAEGSATTLNAGFGSTSTTNKKGGKKSNGNKNGTSAKKKIQIKEKVLKLYGGDIAKGTEERIQNAMAAQPPHIQHMADLYKKIKRWDSSVASMSLMQQSRLPQSDIDGAKRAKGELEALYEQYNVSEEDMHNLFQRLTWDASADAKAAKASIGEIPSHILKRVDKACSIIAECVTSAGRRGRCLDVGCGHGTLIPNLTNAGVYPGQIVGVDLSPEMIRNAEERYRGPKFIATDFLNQFDDEDLFDGVIFCSSLHDLPDMKSSISKAAALLRPEGKLVIFHAQGGGHVDAQHKANPLLVKRGLPMSEELLEWAQEMMLEVEVTPALAHSKKDDDEGYLAVLQKNA